MPEHDRYNRDFDRDAEDSEFTGGQAPFYPSYQLPPVRPIQNGNYQKIVIAWASFVTLIAMGVIALVWNSVTAQINKNTEAIERLRDQTTQLHDQEMRQDQRMDFMQREIEQQRGH